MNRLLAGTAVIALCTFWTGTANAGLFGSDSSDKPTGASMTGTVATQAKPATDEPGNDDPDMADILKNLPSNLDGEIRRAQLLRANGDYKDAAKALSEMMLVAPDDSRVVGEFGKVMVQEGRSQDAVSFLKRAVELAPSEWSFYSALGIAYDQLDDHAHAKVAYQHALALKPNNPTVLNNLAVSRMLAGDLTGAQRLLAQASANGGNNPKIASNVAMLSTMGAPASSALSAIAYSAPHASAPMPSTAASVETNSIGAPRQLPGVSKPATEKPASGPAVVMQKVPTDPMAGPVTQPMKVAKTTHPKKTRSALAFKDASAAPALRTAAQVN